MTEHILNKTISDSTPNNGPNNIFQIWKEIGEIVPFAVRRDNWPYQYYVVVERVEVKNWPYGNAYGYPTENGIFSHHYEYSKDWKEHGLIPCCGCYQWTLVEGAAISKDFSVLDKCPPLKKSHKLSNPPSHKKSVTYTFDEIHETYPKAYAKWTTEDDENLKNLFLSGKTPKELAPIFQRKVGAIESRLMKLGLKPKIL